MLTDRSPFDVMTETYSPVYRPSTYEDIPEVGDTISGQEGLLTGGKAQMDVLAVEEITLDSPGLGRTHGHMPSGKSKTKIFVLAEDRTGDLHEYRWWKENLE
jgi:hypothetical protein